LRNTGRRVADSDVRFGINTFLFASPFTNATTSLFPTFKRWGFDTVEIAVESADDIDPAHVKRKLDENGLAAGTLCACMPPQRDLRGTTVQQQNCKKYLKRLIDHMVVLDCPNLIGPVYSATGRADAVPTDQYKKQWRTVVTNLQDVCAYAEKRGRIISIEPLNRFETDFINTCEQALALIDDVDSPALRILLDTFHMNIEEKDASAAIRKAGSRLGHVHACGSDRGTPGNDHIDWKPIASALRGIRYKGDVVIESFTQDVKVIARAAAIWRKIEPSRDDIAIKGLQFLKRNLG